jgi:ADP-ribose pyrophosphatase YjhB (NUDIX family)
MKRNSVVQDYCHFFPDEKEKIIQIEKQFGALHLVEVNRSSFPIHLTASALIFDSQKIKLVFHPYLKQWLPPGGHLENQETPHEAALREALEETGISCNLHPWHITNHFAPLHIHAHPIPANPKKSEPAHWHLDYCFVLNSTNKITKTTAELSVKSLTKDEAISASPFLTPLIKKLENLLL